MQDLVAKTLIAMHPGLWESYTFSAGTDDYGAKCFHLLGFDVLLDSDCRAHLLEVNNMPSLLCEAPVDEHIKGTVLTDVFRIVKLGRLECAVAAGRVRITIGDAAY